jgi:hypothetical protein
LACNISDPIGLPQSLKYTSDGCVSDVVVASQARNGLELYTVLDESVVLLMEPLLNLLQVRKLVVNPTLKAGPRSCSLEHVKALIG